MIRLTRTIRSGPDHRVGAILTSIDGSILGAAFAIDAYALGDPAGIHPCAGPDHRAGRARVLGLLPARPVIFPEADFAATYDRRAGDNLAREMASLKRELARAGIRAVNRVPADLVPHRAHRKRDTRAACVRLPSKRASVCSTSSRSIASTVEPISMGTTSWGERV